MLFLSILMENERSLSPVTEWCIAKSELHLKIFRILSLSWHVLSNCCLIMLFLLLLLLLGYYIFGHGYRINVSVYYQTRGHSHLLTGVLSRQTKTVPEKLKVKIIYVALMRKRNTQWSRNKYVKASRKILTGKVTLDSLSVGTACCFSF